MKSKLILFILTISSYCLQAQEFTISGRVTDSSGTALSNASVFCQNTTFGTITNAAGQFSLHLPNGGYDLVISYTGFETQMVRINENSTRQLEFRLKPKGKSLEEVAVVATGEVQDGWTKYGQFFRENFIGNDSNALNSKIENPEVLQFFYSKKRNRLKVKAREDLLILNQALGYRVRFSLDSFAYEYGTNASVYTGFPFYEELPGTDAEKLVWKQNREKAYYGSRLHFVRSWYARKLHEEGFIVQKVDALSASPRVLPIENPYDTTLYKTIEDNDVEVSYNGRLRIVYTNAAPDPQYVKESHIPPDFTAQISGLDITDGFVIEQNGYFYDQNDVVNIGYWSWKRLADELPYDYKP